MYPLPMPQIKKAFLKHCDNDTEFETDLEEWEAFRKVLLEVYKEDSSRESVSKRRNYRDGQLQKTNDGG
jgi:hypothetical protein